MTRDAYSDRRALEGLERDARAAGDLERAARYRDALASGDSARVAQIVSAVLWISGMQRAGYVRDADGAWIKP